MDTRETTARNASRPIGLAILTLVLGSVGCGGKSGADPAPAGARALSPAAGSYDWLQFNGDASHSGSNTAESLISAQNVATLKPLFQVALPAVADGAPVLVTGVPTGAGVLDLVFVETTAGHVLALDARTGVTIWSHQNGPGSCGINNGGSPCYTTSSPAIDPSRQFVYSYGLEGRVHKYNVATGAEVTAGGWPEQVTLKPFDEKESSPLVFATDSSGTTYLYVTNSGYPGDQGDYQGHVTAINLSDGSQRVFNALCSDQTVHFVEAPSTPDCGAVQAGIWARSAVVFDARIGKAFAATGNGDFDPGSFEWGDSVFAMNPDGTGGPNGNPVDSYTPLDFQSLQNADADLGSTAPAILPGSGTRYPHLAAQGGKDGMIRLLDLDNLSGNGGPGHTGGEIFLASVPQGNEVLTAPAVWIDPGGKTWLFLANDSGISALTLALDPTGSPSLVTAWQSPQGGTSPLVANGVLYYAGSNHLWALDPTTGATLFDGTSIGGIHWQSPVVANGILYLEDQDAKLNAFSPPSAADFSLSATPSALTLDVGASGTSAISVTPIAGFTGSVTLSASGMPPEVAARFDPTQTTRASTLTVSASNTAMSGTSNLTITGTSGSLVHTTTLSLTVSRSTSGTSGCGEGPAGLTALLGLALARLLRRKNGPRGGR